jgi:hypothetical protein
VSELLSFILTAPQLGGVKPGQSCRFSAITAVAGAAGLSSGTVSLTLEPPVGAPDAALANLSPIADSTASYHFDQVMPAGCSPGYWVERWTSTGSFPSQNALKEQRFLVVALDF